MNVSGSGYFPRFFLCFVLVGTTGSILFTSAACADVKPPACDSIRSAYHRAWEADARGDVAQFLKLFTKDYVCVLSSGKTISYEEVRRSHLPGSRPGKVRQLPFRQVENADYRILNCSVKGNTAVVKALASVVTTLVYPKTHKTWLSGYTKPIVADTWIKGANGWALQHRRILGHNQFSRPLSDRPAY